MISSSDLAGLSADIADTLVDHLDLCALLDVLTTRASEISGADAVALILRDRQGTVRSWGPPDDAGELLELLHLEHGEGPCPVAWRTGRPVVNVSLGDAEWLWPAFVPAARAAGFQVVHVFPMRVRDHVVGVFYLFCRTAIHFDDDDIRVIQGLADVATVAVVQARQLNRVETLASQLQTALNSRILIEQAKGALSYMVSVNVDAAFAIMRQRARSTRTPLAEVAEAVLDRRADGGSYRAIHNHRTQFTRLKER